MTAGTETNPIGTMERLRRCEEAIVDAQKALVMLTQPNAIQSTAVHHAWAAAVAAELKCRRALTPMTKPEQEGV